VGPGEGGGYGGKGIKWGGERGWRGKKERGEGKGGKTR